MDVRNPKAIQSNADVTNSTGHNLEGSFREGKPLRIGPLSARITDALRDLRYAFRTMRRNPGVTAISVLSLALGIGANTAVFSAIDALMLRKLPVHDPDQLVTFNSRPNMLDSAWKDTFAYPQFEEFARDTKNFFSIAAALSSDRANLSMIQPGGREQLLGRMRVSLVSLNYFSLFGVTADRGRIFASDQVPSVDESLTAVISYRCWQREFGAAPNIVGRTFKLNNFIYTIIGVGQKDFLGDELAQPTDLWIPIQSQPRVIVEDPGLARAEVRIIGRLRTGVALPAAQAEVTSVWNQIANRRTTSDSQSPLGESRDVVLQSDATGVLWQRQEFKLPLQILVIVVLLLLLIACANVANLLLAKSATRQGEVALRVSLGAGRGRIWSQLIVESLLMAALAGAAGFAFAMWGTKVVGTLISSGLQTMELDIHPDQRLLVFTAFLGLATGLIFGVIPACRASDTRLSMTLKREARRMSGSIRMDRLLVMGQVSFTIILLIGAILFIRTLVNLKNQDFGFDREHLLMIWTSPAQSGKEGAALAELFGAVQERLPKVPGVVSASPSTSGLLSGTGVATLVKVPGYVPPPGQENSLPIVQRNLVSPGFFKTVGIQFLAGRDFTDADSPTGPRVAIINESMARRYFSRQNALGQHFGVRNDKGNEIEVVGIVKDAKDISPYDSQEMIYLPYRQDISHLAGMMCVAVRVSRAIPDIGTTLHHALNNIDSSLSVLSIDSADQDLDKLLTTERLVAWLGGLFAVLAVGLATIGVYGIMCYAVARRTHEMGIRMALGASRPQVLAMVLKDSMSLIMAGVAIGIPAALAIDRAFNSLLFKVQSTNVTAIVIAVAVMCLAGFIATLLPARRAATVDPMVALRYE